MAFILPIDGEFSRFAVDVPLDGEDFTLSFSWNTRDSRWYLAVSDAAGVELATGVPLVIDTPLLQKFADARMPSGWLMVYDTTDQGGEIVEQEDLGSKVQVVYLDEAEVDAL